MFVLNSDRNFFEESLSIKTIQLIIIMFLMLTINAIIIWIQKLTIVTMPTLLQSVRVKLCITTR